MNSILGLVMWAVLTYTTASKASGVPCSTLDGTWFNELGSSITLTHDDNGDLTGTYVTGVVRENGTTASNHSTIFGSSPYNKPGAVFGFSVMWGDGTSMTTWTGQCLVCSEGEEVLETSWLLKRKVSACGDSWQSTMIGQNAFRRNTISARQKAQVGKVKRETPEAMMTLASQDGGQPCQTLNGLWYNQVGSEMHITTHSDNSIQGEYRTAVERCEGAAGSGHSTVYGVSNTGDPSSTVALYVVWNNGESITGWVGQCHVCGESGNETLLLTWLLRSRIDSCHDNWLATNYGETTFTRHEQVAGPRKSQSKHTPREAGEKTARTSVPCSGNPTASGSILLAIISIVVSSVKLMNLHQ